MPISLSQESTHCPPRPPLLPPGLKYNAVLQLKSTLKFLTYLGSLINVIIVGLQLIVLFFDSGVIQLTLARIRLLKVKTSAVGFTIAMYLTGFRVKGVKAANHVMFQTFTIKDVVGSPFQVTTCVRWKEFSLAMEIKSLVSLYEGVFQEISTN